MYYFSVLFDDKEPAFHNLLLQSNQLEGSSPLHLCITCCISKQEA